jgi:ComF family protein
VRPFLTDTFLVGANRFYSSKDFDAVAPVPLHWWRRFRREFNQAEILSLPLAQSWGLPHLPRAAIRKRLTLPQSRLSGDQRTANMKGMFEPGCDILRGARVLLVDDVMTTGATLSACADALLRGGAYSVSAMTLARRL